MTVLSAAIPATESTVGFCCGCCVTGDCYDDSDCEHGSTEECEGKACVHTCHENRESHECAFCHLAFDTSEKCHEEILADLKELKAEGKLDEIAGKYGLAGSLMQEPILNASR